MTAISKPRSQLSFEEYLEIVGLNYNFFLPSPSRLKADQPPPNIKSGPKKHEILAAYQVAHSHKSTTSCIDTGAAIITISSLIFDEKLLNAGAALIKDEFVGLLNEDGSSVTPAQVIDEYETNS